ncbi:vitamin K epoxide reductase family protein [Corynebacterium testudinoris]|uniref:Putative membrane protein n=1 Tax=Corynebacterium testudinoris TaxID=136857 RepID=A0A0G3HA49_9CORY|nr:vitamin K epoxide reductase family protein [Corynebacterium testudinoris]AKK08047.1 putative membrane protein [Corynebacterium testudinoris]MBX8996840.1 vitamin K epoxide reductase family protein [Corynebacterium testudinoris]
MTDLRDCSDTAAQTVSAAPMAGRRLGVLLLGGGVIGLIAAVVLLVEKIELLKNPDYIPTCNIGPILSCGSVMTTPQAEAFGIPNPVIGIAGFAAIAVVGAAILAGAGFRPWFRVATQAGVSFAVVFVHWLIYQSLYVIGALCPYCMVVWAVTIPLFWYTTLVNLQLLRDTGPAWARTAIRIATSYHGVVLTVWVLAIIILISHRFWDYWTTLI